MESSCPSFAAGKVRCPIVLLRIVDVLSLIVHVPRPRGIPCMEYSSKAFGTRASPLPRPSDLTISLPSFCSDASQSPALTLLCLEFSATPDPLVHSSSCSHPSSLPVPSLLPSCPYFSRCLLRFCWLPGQSSLLLTQSSEKWVHTANAVISFQMWNVAILQFVTSPSHKPR